MKKIVAPDGVLLNDAQRARLSAHGELTCLSETCVRNVEAYLAGRPQNVITKGAP